MRISAVSCGPEEVLLTVMVTSLVLVNVPSLPVRRRTYVPVVLKLAVVLSKLAFPNVTVPGPENLLRAVVSVPLGKPSSLAEPTRLADAGRLIDCGLPALTIGGVLSVVIVKFATLTALQIVPFFTRTLIVELPLRTIAPL